MPSIGPMDAATEPVQIQLTHDEALVLCDWLWKRDRDDALEPLIEHWSEQLVLWSVHALLEKTLPELFDPDYARLVAAARERLVADLEPENRKRAK